MNQSLSLNNIRITCFSLFILLVVAVGGFFYFQLDSLNQRVSEPIKKERPFLTDIIEIQRLTSLLDLHLHKQIAGNYVDTEAAIRVIDSIFSAVENLSSQNVIRGKERKYVVGFTEDLKRLRVAFLYYRINPLLDPANSEDDGLYRTIDATQTSMSQNLNSIIAIMLRQIRESDHKVLDGLTFLQEFLVFVFSSIVIGSLFILFIFNKSLSANLGKLLQGTKRVGEGDLDWRINSKFTDQLGQLSNAFDTMAHKLGESKKHISQQTKKIEKLAYYDSLTELPNRNSFLVRLEQEVERASRAHEKLAILFVDLDDFKRVNDMYGHEIGDLLLKEVSERMRQYTRLSDIVSRLGADEFAILLTQQDSPMDSSLVGKRIQDELDRPLQLSQKIIEDLGKPFHLGEKEVFVSSSIGIAIYPDNGTEAQELLRNADTAMYAAKSEGKNSFRFCSEEMASRMGELYEMEKDLRRALVKDEFVLYYQPQIDLQTEKLSGFEALIRWIHPEKGFISPLDFIPLAEERGLIHEISKWVLKTACRQQKAWEQAGHVLVPVMINLSGRDFHRQDIGTFISDFLVQEGLDPSLLGLEVTETSVMEDKVSAIETLASMKKLGVKIALDDFGTGYSSLNYLQLLPIDVVKIDRSFIIDITSVPENAAITKAVIDMAHALDLKVLAEGVETEEQKEFVKEMHCDFVQGYLFSKPLPEQEAAAFFKQDS